MTSINNRVICDDYGQGLVNCFVQNIFTQQLCLWVLVFGCFLITPNVFAAQSCTTSQIAGNNDDFLGVSGSSDSNVVATGKDGVIYRYDGSTWAEETSAVNQDLNAVSVLDTNTAVAVGDRGDITIYYGGSWSSSNSGTNDDLDGVWVYASNDVYAVGENGTVLHYDGSNWSDISAAAGTSNVDLEDAWGDSTAFYALAKDGTLYRYDRGAGTWSTIVTCVSVVSDDTRALWGDGSGNIYIAGKDGAVYLYDGSSCALVATASEDLRGIYGNMSTGEIYAVGKDGAVMYYTGSTWLETTEGTEDIRDVWVSDSGNAYYGAKRGYASSCAYTPNTAPTCNIISLGGGIDFDDTSGSSDSNVVVTGKNGVIYRYDGNAWAEETSAVNQDLNAVSVLDTSTAVAVGDRGDITIYSGGSWSSSNSGTNDDLDGVWVYASNDVFAVGENGTVLHYDGSSWSNISAAAGTSSEDLEDAWGDSTAFYALAKDGTLYRYDRSADTWSTIVTCVSAVSDDTRALWGDGAGNIYIAGKDGAVYLYDGSSCSQIATASEDLRGIYGSAPTGEIYAVGKNGVVLYFDGSAWSESTAGTEDLRGVWVSASSGVPYYAGKRGTVISCTAPSLLSHFVLTHDRLGISCAAEPVSVTAALTGGATDTSYSGTIILDTQSGTGTWTLSSGSGTFADTTADDGMAAYTFDPADLGVASFDLDYQSGTGSIDVDTYEGATRDDDTEGNLVFSPSGFTVTATALNNPPTLPIDLSIPSQTAAAAFNLHLTAYGQIPTDSTCGVIESYDGIKSLGFWSTYMNPISGALQMTVDGVGVETTESARVAQNVTFNQGQAQINVNYPDVGLMALAMRDDTTGNPDLPTGLYGTSQSFVVKPADFVLSNVIRSSDSFPNPATAVDENGAAFMAAGDNFSVMVTAVNALGNATPNYAQESTPESVSLTSTLVAAGAANNPAVGFTVGFGGFVNGVATGTDFHWDEVGIITLTPSVADGDYLGAGDVTGTVSANVGRFYPDHFVTAKTDGSFANTCATATAFTYLGESFDYLGSPTVTATAESALNTITANYTDAWAKLGVAGVSFTYPSADNTQLDEGGVAAIGVTSTEGTHGRVDNADGSLTFTLGGAAADSFAYARDAGQVAPFASDLTIQLTAVSDGEASASDLGTPKSINPIGNLQRFGRGYAQDVHGTMSQTGDSLTMPIGSWFFDAGGVWSLNTDDSCSSYTYTKVDAGITTVASSASPVSLISGLGSLTLGITADAGGPGGTSVVNTVWPSWLQYDVDGVDQLLDGNSYDDDFSATATFGIFRGDDRYLYWREAP